MEDRELLSKHARHPSHVGDPQSLALQGACKNPLCGDAVDIGVELTGDVITDVLILASGCAISISSASLMTETVQGKHIHQALDRFDTFRAALIEPASSTWPLQIQSLRPFARLRESPTRVPCALIAWFALKAAISKR